MFFILSGMLAALIVVTFGGLSLRELAELAFLENFCETFWKVMEVQRHLIY